MRLLFAFIAGGLFGAGLFVSGMTDTSKVQGWLDVFGDWDPTLAFVMGGAIIPMAIAWRLVLYTPSLCETCLLIILFYLIDYYIYCIVIPNCYV